jgi:hypothetical protein
MMGIDVRCYRENANQKLETGCVSWRLVRVWVEGKPTGSA